MNLTDQLFSAVLQILVAIVLGLLTFALSRGFSRNISDKPSFFKYIGFSPATPQLDSKFLLILVAVILFGVSCTVLQFQYSDTFKCYSVMDSA